MEKIKNLLSPAHTTDEDTMYGEGDNSGKVAGEGSHFGDVKSGSYPTGTSEGVGMTGGSSNVPSDAASTTALKEGVSGPYSETTTGAHSDAIKAAQLATGTTNTSSQGDAGRGLPIYSEMTGHQDNSKATNPYSSHGVDPRVDGSQSHSKKDATLGGGLGSAAAATGYELDKSNRGPEYENVATAPAYATGASQTTATDPIAESSNIGTAVTTGADPRYSSTTSSVPNPETGAAAHSSSIDTTPSAATTSSALPAVSGKTVNEPEHHFGRDAALGTGVGAAGLAAYETGKHHETSTQNTSNTSGTAGSEGSGPLGSLRDLINQKVGAGGSSTTNANATSALHSTTNEPSSTANTGATSTSRSTTQEPSSADASGLGVGSIRPLVDEKTHSTGTGPSSNQLDSSTGATGSGSGRLDDSTGAAGLPTESIRPLVDEKTNTAGIGSSSNQLNSSTSATGLGSGQFDGSTDPDTFATRETATNPSTGDRAGAIASDTSRSAQSDRHYARDTAAGAVAGAGLAGSYDYLRGHNDTTSRTDTAVPGISDPVSTAGPSHISSGAGTSGLANTSSTTRPSDFQSSTPVQPVANETGNEKEHHYGRDAALGAGAAGVGAAAYEHHQHEGYDKAEEKARKEAEKQHEKDIKEAEKQQQKEIKQHEKEVKAAEKQHEKDVKAAEKQHEKELKAQDEELAKAERHRHEKEAAFAGVAGAGAAGIAAHEHNKKDDLGYTSSTTAPYQSGAGDPTQRDRIASIADTRAEGRLHSTDAGVAGATGLGAGGVAAHEHGSDAEPKERKGSILDIFKRHKNDDESHDKHKHGKEAATGAGVLGAGALGAHEYEKHHGSSTGASTIDPARSDPSTDFPQSVSEQKVYRDSLGHFKRDPNERSIEPSSSGAGVIRDGLGHMQPGETTGTSTIPDRTDHSHRGLETAAGGAGLAGAGAFGAHEYEKHHQANTTGTGVTSNTGVGSTVPTTDTSNYTSNTGIGNTATTDATGRDHHHRGLEATAAGAGLAGAGTLGAHEYEKHHHSGTTDTGLTGNTDVGNTVPAANTSNYMSNTGVENTAPTDTIVKDHHRGIEGAAAATGVGAIGAHEYNKHHNTTGAAATESQVNPAYDHPAAGSRLAETTNTSHHHHHHKEEAAAAGAAGGLGAAAIAHDKSATGTTGDLGDSRGWVHEGYVHHKTPADLEAEQRNNTPGLGLFHREGRFHGKEGGAPGAVGVPPSERDAAYIESQKHLPTLHGNTGAHGEERSGTDGTYNAYDGSKHNKLHKDPPAGHPAALAAAGAGTGMGAGMGAETSTAGESNLLHGHHAGSLKDTSDTNVENPKHDPAGMGYDGKTHLNLG